MRYKQAQVQRRVDVDLAALAEFKNLHGIELANLDDFIVPLRHESFEQSSPRATSALIGLWVVLDEMPNTNEGYLVVYCPRRASYGLATKGNSRHRPSFIGFYGSLRETLEGM